MELQVKELYKRFGAKEVLRGVSFCVQSGKAFGLLGRNGAGKTTTLRILMNVFPADDGQILLDGKPVDYRSVGIGYLPEERGLYPKKKIGEQLEYFARLKGMSRADASKAVDKWLARLDMSDCKTKKLDTLSKGNQQKIQLVTALAHDPQIIILDEPFSGLDPVNAMLLKDIVREEIARDKIVLFSSHQMNYIEEFCDEIAILRDGAVALSGDLYTIKRSYPRDRLFVRSPEQDKILAELGGTVEDGGVMLRLEHAGDKAEMLRRLTAFDLDEVRVPEPTLGDIFVEYAGEKEGGR